MITLVGIIAFALLIAVPPLIPQKSNNLTHLDKITSTQWYEAENKLQDLNFTLDNTINMEGEMQRAFQKLKGEINREGEKK